VHICAGDVLRDEKDGKGSVFKEEIEKAMQEGKLVSPETIIPILKKGIDKHIADGETNILLDGFPRDQQQAAAFALTVGSCSSLFACLYPKTAISLTSLWLAFVVWYTITGTILQVFGKNPP
jgi:hypothetical protein